MLSWLPPAVTLRLVLAATTTLASASRPAGAAVSAAAIDIAATDSVAAIADATTVPISGPEPRRSPASTQLRIRAALPQGQHMRVVRPARRVRRGHPPPRPAPGDPGSGPPCPPARTPPDRRTASPAGRA